MNEATPTEAREEALSCLEKLIEINLDAQHGFAESAAHLIEPGLQDLFIKYAAERAAFAVELQDLERQHGKPEADDSGTATGALHRSWINLRSSLSSESDLAILEEAERGEDAAVAAYRKALEPADIPLPRSITSVVERHLPKVQAVHDEVRRLRNAARAVAKAS